MSRRPAHIPGRKAIPESVKREARERASGICAGCGVPFTDHGFHYDHIIPVALGGENTAQNIQLLCFGCHAKKTAADIARIAKADRQARRSGQQKRRKAGKTQKLQSRGFNTRFKKKLDGSFVKREAH